MKSRLPCAGMSPRAGRSRLKSGKGLAVLVVTEPLGPARRRIRPAAIDQIAGVEWLILSWSSLATRKSGLRLARIWTHSASWG